MVIVGADDRLTPPSLSEEIHLALPNAQLHVIPDCGHLPPLEKPEDVASLLYNLMETSLSTSVGS
jgi:pimeloyl-ACP methyl ester carboxylesterase